MPTSTNGKTWGVAGELEEPVNEGIVGLCGLPQGLMRTNTENKL